MDEQKFSDDLAKLKKEEDRLNVGRPKPGAADEGPADRSRAMRYTWLGAEFAAIFVAFTYGGITLDKKLGSHPWFTLIGVSCGFSIALYRLIFVARKLSEEK